MLRVTTRVHFGPLNSSIQLTAPLPALGNGIAEIKATVWAYLHSASWTTSWPPPGGLPVPTPMVSQPLVSHLPIMCFLFFFCRETRLILLSNISQASGIFFSLPLGSTQQMDFKFLIKGGAEALTASLHADSVFNKYLQWEDWFVCVLIVLTNVLGPMVMSGYSGRLWSCESQPQFWTKFQVWEWLQQVLDVHQMDVSSFPFQNFDMDGHQLCNLSHQDFIHAAGSVGSILFQSVTELKWGGRF